MLLRSAFSSPEQNHTNIRNLLNITTTSSILLSLVVIVSSCFLVCTSHGACSRLDRDSLSSFNSSISTVIPLNWSLSIDCCSWEGVGCDKSSGRVTNLSLPSRGLVGTISPSIVNLTSLSHLSLSRNQLSGSLPGGFFVSLNRLRVIDLSHNRLSGEIPLSDRLPATIQIFNLSSNHFHGTIQSSFLQPASKLETFDVSNNSFIGQIPSSICSFLPSNSIQHLDFSNNDFSGPIPEGSFGQCKKLRSLRAGFLTNLSGEIPRDIYGLLNLQELHLPGNKLSGRIDERIVNLSNLRILSLYGNQLTGTIPQEIGRLTELEQLQLHINQLNGTIPSSLTNCTKLTTLNLRVNFLEGELSAFDFSKFVQLRSVDLGNNYFQGSLPATLFSCKTLTAVRLATNNLSGEVLPEIGALQSLSFLTLSNNSLTNLTSAIRILAGCKNLTTLIMSKNFYDEPLPPGNEQIDDKGFQNLRILGIGGCRLTGQVPTWLSKLHRLEVLSLSHNNITGTIPGWLGGLPNLFYLDLSSNQLSGFFPMELLGLRRLAFHQNPDEADTSYLELPVFVQPNNVNNLQYNRLSNLPPAIYLGDNSINGTIPIEIGQLKFIVALELQNNNFFGKIPDAISHLTYLEILDLSGNRLSGEIPASFKNLNFMSEFSVANNDLQGPIPTGGQFDTFPMSSFEGNPRLCGQILQRPCTTSHSRSGEAPQEDESEEETGVINWVSFGIGFVVSFIIAEVAALGFFKLYQPKSNRRRRRS